MLEIFGNDFDNFFECFVIVVLVVGGCSFCFVVWCCDRYDGFVIGMVVIK